jgi:hypothetical protein
MHGSSRVLAHNWSSDSSSGKSTLPARGPKSIDFESKHFNDDAIGVGTVGKVIDEVGMGIGAQVVE